MGIRNKSGRLRLPALTITIAIAVVAGSVPLVRNFLSKSSSYIDNSAIENIHEMIGMVAYPYSAKVSRIVKDLSLIDRQISEVSGTRSIIPDDIDPFVNTMMESEGASCIAFLDRKCRYTTTEGDSGLLDVTLDIVRLFGDKEPLVRNLSWRGGQSRYIVAIPVEDFSVDGKVYNAIFATFAPETMGVIFENGLYSGKANVYLVDNTGIILLSNTTNSSRSENLLSLYRAQGTLDGDQVETVKNDFKACRSGDFTIYKDGVETFFCYQSTNNLHNILVEIPADVARSSLTEYGSMITRTVLVMVLILLVLFLVISELYFISKRDRAVAIQEKMSKDALEKSNTKLKAARQAAEEASMAKSVFLSNMSHDIRTPMNAIIGYTGLAMSHMDDKTRLDDYLRKISQSSSHLLNLINDVLDMSRIESGKMTIDNKPENLADILASVNSIIESDVEKKSQHFTMDTGGLKDVHVLCDRLHLNQVLLNILSNAIKYTPDCGDISLTVSQLEDSSEGTAAYAFSVKDNGIGMTEDFIKTIFEPFSRERNSTVSGIQGTGLGMSITKNLIEKMGGTIDVKSEKGKGTEISFQLEFDIDDNVAPENDNLMAEYDFRGKKILLVEDNELNREIATMILEDEGLVVDTAEDGTVAVEKISKAQVGDYDVILMDIQMPIMNGYDATRQIRALGAPLSGIPIIAMTANAFDEDRKAAFEAGMDDHVSKPVDVPKLKEALSKVLGHVK